LSIQLLRGASSGTTVNAWAGSGAATTISGTGFDSTASGAAPNFFLKKLNIE